MATKNGHKEGMICSAPIEKFKQHAALEVVRKVLSGPALYGKE
jgi:hypothetical protein